MRAAVVVLVAPTPEYDAAVYHSMAQQIVLGEGVHAHGLRALRPPLYAAFLAGVYALGGVSVLAAQLAQLGLSTALLLVLFLCTRELFGRAAAWVALVAGALHPQLVRYPSLLLSENLYLPLLLTAFWLAARSSRRRVAGAGRHLAPAGLAGVLFGLASLVRELALPVGAVLTLCWLVAALRAGGAERRAGLLRAACFGAGMALAVAPWTVRNYLLLGGFVPVTTNFGWVLYLGFNPNATGYYHPFVALTNAPRFTSELEINRYLQQQALDWMQQNPLRAAELTALRVWLFWRPFFVSTTGDGRVGLVFAAAKTVACAAIFAGALLARHRWRDPRLLPVVVLCLVSTVAHGLTHMEAGGRYRLPVEVALIPLAGAGLAWVACRAGSAAAPKSAPTGEPRSCR